MSKRIAIDCRVWGTRKGGIGRYAQELVNNISRLDSDNNYTVILLPEDANDLNLPNNFSILPLNIPHFSLSEQLKLSKELNVRNFDLVHFTNFNHPIMYRRPFVVTVHDLIMHYYPSGRSQRSLIRRLAYKAVMKDCRRAEKIIVPSNATKNDLISKLHFKKEKIIVTAEGSSKNFRLHKADEIDAIRQKYKLPKRYLLFVSRWEPYKGLPELLVAYYELIKNDPELGLVIIGKPDKQSPQITNLVDSAQKELKNVCLPGFVSDADLAAIYSAATIYVHPSWYEGFGIMILEAFASGVPVITTNVSSLPEVAGDAAVLVPPKDPIALAAAIKDLLPDRNRRQELINFGLVREKGFSWQKMAEQTLNVYQQAGTQT